MLSCFFHELRLKLSVVRLKMNRHLPLASLLFVFTALQVPGAAPAELAALGDLHGVIRDPQGSPVAAATVVARNLDANTDRTAVSGVDGAFRVTNLMPGRYELTAKKDGAGIAPPTIVQLAAEQSLTVDVTLSGNAAECAGGAYGGTLNACTLSGNSAISCVIARQ